MSLGPVDIAALGIRQAARASVDIPVIARVSDLGIFEARVIDLGVGGLALQCGQPLQIDQEVLLMFSLPGTNDVIHITGKIVNGNATGRAGVRFSFVPEEDLSLLESWLATELARLENAGMPVGEARVAPNDAGLGKDVSSAQVYCAKNFGVLNMAASRH